MNKILTSSFDKDDIGAKQDMPIHEDQVLEMYLEHLKSLMIKMIDNRFLYVEK
jgi:hypothetical protein